MSSSTSATPLRRLLILGGGTGGHIAPALAVAQGARQLTPPWDVLWIGSEAGLESQWVRAAHIPLLTLPTPRLRGQSFLQRLKNALPLAKSFWQAFKAIRHYRPHLAIAWGGFAAGPGSLVARSLGIPLWIHEQNAKPCLTNRLLAPVAHRLLEAFPHTFHAYPHKTTTLGNPLRTDLKSDLARDYRTKQAMGIPFQLLILGGSQGARFLNEIMPSALAILPTLVKLQVIHQTGAADLERTKALYEQQLQHHPHIQVHLKPFIENMPEVYERSDFAVARAGALTISELAASGLPSILIPYPNATDDHQYHNAQYLAQTKAAIVLRQHATSKEELSHLIAEWLAEPDRLQKMHEACKTAAAPKALSQLLDDLKRFGMPT